MSGVLVLGATGSVGRRTLDVIALHPDRYRVAGLAARSDVAGMTELCRIWSPPRAAMSDEGAARELAVALRTLAPRTEVLAGPGALEELARDPAADIVMAAISGAAGLPSTLAAAAAGKRLLLANKESVVMAGPLLLAALTASGGTLIPIDSEHNAIFQCLPAGAGAGVGAGAPAPGVRRLFLTASGGPFLDWPIESMARVSPEEACRHPRWSMGRKISVDSASMMNKGLELIEATILFGVPADRVEIVVHPESVVHSLVEYVDGSLLAQLGSPDMRVPIAVGLAWPERIAAGVEFVDLVRLGTLGFRAPDERRFPALRLARAAARAGGLAGCWISAANEVAVGAFLDKQLNFGDIPAVIEATMADFGGGAVTDLAAVLEADRTARARAAVAVRACIGAAA